MANIPNGTYPVQLGKAANNWANGSLNTNFTPPKYKGNDVSNYNGDVNNVSFTVTLTHGTCTGPLNFVGGVYTAGPPQAINSGTVTGACLSSSVEKDPEDTWSASAGAGEDAYSKKAGSQ